MNPALYGKIVEESSDGVNRIGIVEFDGKRRPVYLNLVANAHQGDYVKFQAGFATERIESPAPDAVEEVRPEGEIRNPETDLSSVQAYRLLRDLDPQQLRKLLPLAQEERYAAGQIVFRAGEQSLSLHLIVSGEVALEGGHKKN
jgi:hydrogenase maturation factor